MKGGVVNNICPWSLLSDLLRAYNSIYGSGDEKWYEDESEIPPDTSYYNIWDGQIHRKGFNGSDDLMF
jgi:hypothetical protein